MILTTFIARSSDGLLLAENYDDNNQELLKAKRKIKLFLKTEERREDSSNLKCIDVDNYILHSKTQEGILYMVLCDKRYPVKLANSYLEDLHLNFQEELKSQFGTQGVDYRSKIETIEEPYYFLKFDKSIKKLKQDYQDTRSDTNLDRLKSDLLNVHDIMKENIDLLLDREKNLNKMLDQSKKLKENSKKFKDKANKLEWNLWLKKNAVFMVIIAVILLYLSWKFLL